MCTDTCAYKGITNVSFSENSAYVLNEWFLIYTIILHFDETHLDAVRDLFN